MRVFFITHKVISGNCKEKSMNKVSKLEEDRFLVLYFIQDE